MQIARRTGRGRGPLRVAVVAAAIGLVASGCGGAKVGATSSAGGGSSGKCGTFNLAVNPWVGYEANAAVIALRRREASSAARW